jgi:xanthine dehydrogenase accessory protein XdhC
MTPLAAALDEMLKAGEAAVLVTILEAQGSTPREAGATMLVTARRAIGTIGGGQLEFHASDLARRLLETGEKALEVPLSLGPAMGQCCGGRVRLGLKRAGPGDVECLAEREKGEHNARPMVVIFGAGHVGRALAEAMALLPLHVLLVDDREAELALSAASVEMRLMDDPDMALRDAPPGSAALIMTHSHSLDYRLAESALRAGRFAYVGLIGSATKRARFVAHARRSGPLDLSRFHCPIGGASEGRGVPDKRPEVIAALATADVVRAVMSPASWSGLARPSTSFLNGSQVVDGRAKPDHDGKDEGAAA